MLMRWNLNCGPLWLDEMRWDLDERRKIVVDDIKYSIMLQLRNKTFLQDDIRLWNRRSTFTIMKPFIGPAHFLGVLGLYCKRLLPMYVKRTYKLGRSYGFQRASGKNMRCACHLSARHAVLALDFHGCRWLVLLPVFVLFFFFFDHLPEPCKIICMELTYRLNSHSFSETYNGWPHGSSLVSQSTIAGHCNLSNPKVCKMLQNLIQVKTYNSSVRAPHLRRLQVPTSRTLSIVAWL